MSASGTPRGRANLASKPGRVRREPTRTKHREDEDEGAPSTVAIGPEEVRK